MSAFNRIETSSSDEEGSRGKSVHISDTNSSSSSPSLPVAVNAELLRMMLSPGHPTRPPSDHPTSESIKNALHEKIIAMLCSQRNSKLVPSSVPAVNTTSQLWGANGATPYPMTTTQLYPGERHMMSMMRTGAFSLPAPRLIPNGTMTTIEQQLNVWVQQQRAQQAITALASMNADSRSLLIRPNEPQQLQPPPSLKLLQFLARGEHDRVTLSDTLLQAQAQAHAGLQSPMFSFGNRATQPTSSGAPTMTPIPIPQRKSSVGRSVKSSHSCKKALSHTFSSFHL
jgi:hypothetical protein